MDSGPVVAPKLPDVEVQGNVMAGEEAVLEMGATLAENFSQQWSASGRRKASGTKLDDGARLDGTSAQDLLAGGAYTGIDDYAPDALYFLYDECCGVHELEVPSAVQMEDWELQDEVRSGVVAAFQSWQPGQVTMTGGGRLIPNAVPLLSSHGH